MAGLAITHIPHTYTVKSRAKAIFMSCAHVKFAEDEENCRAKVQKKNSLRSYVWDTFELHNLAPFPRPVHGRIPNFYGSRKAAQNFGQTMEYQRATCIKVLTLYNYVDSSLNIHGVIVSANALHLCHKCITPT